MTLVKSDLTHEQAWRLIDKLNSEPVSPAQDRTDYSWQRFLEEGW